MPKPPASDALLTPSELARVFKVHPNTVTVWAERGRLPSFKTPGGHRRFLVSDVNAFLVSQGKEPLPVEDVA